MAFPNSYLLRFFELSSSMILNYLARPRIPLEPLVASFSFNFSAKASGLFPADFKEVPFIGSGVSLTYDQTNVRAKTSVTRYTAFPSIDEENDYQCVNNNSNDSNDLEFGFEML